MEIRKITRHKKQYLPLLLLGDEQESMIDRYLSRGTLYVLLDNGLKGVCVVTDEGTLPEGGWPENGRVLEIKNIAITPSCQKQGYGKALIRFIEDTYRQSYTVLQVGTGDSPLTLPFYEACGFTVSHRVKDFFTQHYDHPIIENGVPLTDMVYLRKKL